MSISFHGRSNSVPSMQHPQAAHMLRLSITNKALSQVQVEKLLDGSLRILDLCNVAKDALSQMKEGLKEIQSTLQRKCGDLSAEVKKYLATRNILKKSLQKACRKWSLVSKLMSQNKTTCEAEANEFTRVDYVYQSEKSLKMECADARVGCRGRLRLRRSRWCPPPLCLSFFLRLSSSSSSLLSFSVALIPCASARTRSGASYLDLWRSKAEEWMSGWGHGVGSGLGRGNCGPSSSSCLAGLRWCVFGPVNLFLGSLSELLSFPNQFDQRRVLRRRSLCEEVSCRSCQLRLSFSVAARVEAAGVLDDLGLPRLLVAFGCRLLFLSSWCRCDGVWWLIGASSPNKARPFLFRVPWSRV
ncbi:hypothetical protein DY000_02009885 [Brassica cretica]|uniref:Uncharacterized protein n=1 Tax=Brassica cretica TaxID=69181 RepID=A0ABQ7BYU9_BRACR|nr:hypothetical protein DY000_02009885 [Brassica cretica]